MASPSNIAETPAETTRLKRRQSSESEQQENKKPRISPGKTLLEGDKDIPEKDKGSTNGVSLDTSKSNRDSIPKQASDPKERRRRGDVDVKGRSRRLFGAALLGNLSQGGDRTAKRRQEIESRRKAELQRQDDERLEDNQKQLDQVIARRRKEQVNVDRDAMHTRHSNLLHRAKFLHTKTEPRLYYRPWELRPDEEDLIDQQGRDTREEIDQEVEEFELQCNSGETTENVAPTEIAAKRGQNGARLERDHGVEESLSKAVREGDVSLQQDLDDKQQEGHDDKTKATTPQNENHPTTALSLVEGKGDAVDDDGDHVVEGDEDTVIY